eukprot:364735-Chlamydomonas_euryale.AAC.2
MDSGGRCLNCQVYTIGLNERQAAGAPPVGSSLPLQLSSKGRLEQPRGKGRLEQRPAKADSSSVAAKADSSSVRQRHTRAASGKGRLKQRPAKAHSSSVRQRQT